MDKSDNRLSKKIIIQNELGLHARPAARIAEIALNATAGIWIIKDGEKVDASSIIDILTLACIKGTEIMLRIDDYSDIDILNKIVELIKKEFEE